MSIDRSDLREIERQLKRIADALDRAYPKPPEDAPAPPLPRMAGPTTEREWP